MSQNYHLEEFRVATDPNHPSHLLPPAVPSGARILDVGCGAGQTMIAAYTDRVCFGLDPDWSALRLGRSLTEKVRFSCGAAEALPYRSGEFDLVVARVSLAYTDISASLAEIRRVLRTDGMLWMTLHPFSQVWNQAKHANAKGRLFFLYVAANGLSFHFLQRQFSLFGRQESFQTEKGIVRALRRAGFRDVRVERNAHFLVTARV
jgi:ubiquinone/menaquinone biosynthesis C-methylase UbiE